MHVCAATPRNDDFGAAGRRHVRTFHIGEMDLASTVSPPTIALAAMYSGRIPESI
jgi:hypothetical protein